MTSAGIVSHEGYRNLEQKWYTFVPGTADFAFHGESFLGLNFGEEGAAVCTEQKAADRRHGG